MDVNDILSAAIPADTTAAAETPAVADAPADATVADAPADATAAEETAVVETPEVKAAIAKLQAAALKKQNERAAKEQAKARAELVERENSSLKTRLTAVEARAAEIEAFERDPLEWAEKHNVDPVALLQKMHAIALNAPATNAERIAKQALEKAEALEKRGDPQQTVNAALQARELQAAQVDLVAESERGEYPLLAAEDPEYRIALATREAKKLVKDGNTNFGYAELCKSIEDSLEQDLERKNKALAAAKPPKTKTPQATNGARTVTNTDAAANEIAVSKMTQQQLDEAADRLIESAFFNH